MIELRDDRLVISLPEVYEDAQMTIDFQRTLRIPDDGREYPLPAGLGRFPVRHIDDYAATLPSEWVDHGGVMLPMHQSEALWLNFTGMRTWLDGGAYAFAVRVGTGKIDALTGEPWTDELRPAPQNYLVIPSQPWLDGYCVEKDVIRQFVAMPLGLGYTAEEQLTQRAQVGGLQILAYPMKRDDWARRRLEDELTRDREAWAEEGRLKELREAWGTALREYEALAFRYFGKARSPEPGEPPEALSPEDLVELEGCRRRLQHYREAYLNALRGLLRPAPAARFWAMERGATGLAMGLAPGGRMRQRIYQDPYGIGAWDRQHYARCFVHIANSQVWATITGERPPTQPISRTEYQQHRLPWFDYYAEAERGLDGSTTLSKLKSVWNLAREKGETSSPDNASIQVERVVELRKGLHVGQVREAVSSFRDD